MLVVAINAGRCHRHIRVNGRIVFHATQLFFPIEVFTRVIGNVLQALFLDLGTWGVLFVYRPQGLQRVGKRIGALGYGFGTKTEHLSGQRRAILQIFPMFICLDEFTIGGQSLDDQFGVVSTIRCHYRKQGICHQLWINTHGFWFFTFTTCYQSQAACQCQRTP